MGKWIPQAIMDLPLIEIQKADEICICSDYPTTYYNAHKPGVWTSSTLVTVGTLKSPATGNGCIYECIVEGTTGSSSPGWNLIQDGETIDNTVTWKTHYNYALANAILLSGDKLIEDSVSPVGRKLNISEKSNILCHTSGTVNHMALIDSFDLSLKLVSTGETVLPENNDLVSGRLISITRFEYIIKAPV